MRFPFELFCSPGLGLSHSSRDFVTLNSRRNINASKSQIDINAATGNTVIRDTAFIIQDDQVNLTLGMVWNAQDKKWRFAVVPKLNIVNPVWKHLPNMVARPKITLTEADGRILSYKWNKNRQVYQCTAADKDGISTIKWNTDNTYERFYAGSGLKETFDSTGRLSKKVVETGQQLDYGYDSNNEVNLIHLPSGRDILFLADQDNVGKRHLMLDDKMQQPSHLASYLLGTSSLVTEIPDGNNTLFKTDYQLEKQDNGFTLAISGSDKTNTVLSFTDKGVINELREGDRKWNFTHHLPSYVMQIFNETTLRPYEVEFDQGSRLAKFTSPTGDQTKYLFTPFNQLNTVTAMDNAVDYFTYEKNTGLIDSISKGLNSKTQFIYETNPLSPLFGVKRAEINKDDQTRPPHLFIHNTERQCLYQLTPSGRVSKFEYDKENHLIYVKKVTTKFKPCALENTTLQTLDEWWQTLTADDLQRLELDHFKYDEYGRKNEIITYTGLDQQGVAVEKMDTAFTHLVLDEIGRTTLNVVATEYGDPEKNITTLSIYDGLNRATEIHTATKKTHFQYEQNQTEITHSSGLTEKIIKDSGALVSEKIRVDTKNNQERVETHKRNDAGEVITLIRADQLKEHTWHDAMGRLHYVLLPNGMVSGYEYDVQSHVSCRKYYDLKTDLHTTNLSREDIEQLIENQPPMLTHYYFYDNKENLHYEVKVKQVIDQNGKSELQGFVTRHEYSFKNKIKTVKHSQTITDIQNLTYAKIDRIATDLLTFSANEDRETTYFYDDDDLLIGQQSLCNYLKIETDLEVPLGFFKQYEHDGAGRVYHEITYLEKSPFSTLLNIACPDSNTKKLETWHWYDNAGRKTATLDADKHLTTYTYFANGKLRAENAFLLPLEINTTALSLENMQSIILPIPDPAKDKIIEHAYDEEGRENTIINRQTQLQITIDYDDEDHEISRILTDLNTGKTREMYKEYNLFGELQREATVRISAKYKKDNKKWIYNEIHPKTGLVLHTVDAEINKTFFYYNADRKPILQITAGGAVTQFRYDVLSGKATEIYQFYNRFDPSYLSSLPQNQEDQNGFINDTILAKLPDKHEKDRITSREYDAEALLLNETMPNQAKNKYSYNSFSECNHEKHQIDAQETISLHSEHDLRGNIERIIKDPDGLNIITETQFDDPLNRPTQVTDECHHRIAIEYTGLRQQHLLDGDGKKNLIQDAFMRPQSESNWSNSYVTQHTYDNKTRTHTIITPENREKIEELNAFDEVISHRQGDRKTTYEQGVDGQIEKTTYPDQSVETNEINTMGLLEMHTASNGKVTHFIRNNVGHVCNKINSFNDYIIRETKYEPNVFGENEVIHNPDGQTIKIDLLDAGLTKKITTDPEKLNLVAIENYHFDGELKKLSQGDAVDSAQYQENVIRDKLNREIERNVEMENGSQLILSKKTYDAASRLTTVEDGNGGIHRNIYDARGLLKFAINPEGFVIEKTYDEDKNLILEYHYAVPLTQNELALLTDNSIPHITLNCQDRVRHFIYDNDQLLRYEINFVDQSRASVLEWQYNEYGEKNKRINYAAYFDGLNQAIPLLKI